MLESRFLQLLSPFLYSNAALQQPSTSGATPPLYASPVTEPSQADLCNGGVGGEIGTNCASMSTPPAGAGAATGGSINPTPLSNPPSSPPPSTTPSSINPPTSTPPSSASPSGGSSSSPSTQSHPNDGGSNTGGAILDGARLTGEFIPISTPVGSASVSASTAPSVGASDLPTQPDISDGDVLPAKGDQASSASSVVEGSLGSSAGGEPNLAWVLPCLLFTALVVMHRG